MPTSLFLVAGVFAALSLPLSVGAANAPAAQPSAIPVYFGTYTGSKSKGIYLSRLTLATGRLTPPRLVAETASPSFLAVHPSRRFLYAVNEISDFDGRKSGAISAFAIDEDSGELRLLNQQPSGGGGPCHVTVDSRGQSVLLANYGGGSCAVFTLESNGRLGARTAFFQHEGSSVNRQRQEGPHAHGIYTDSRSRFALVPDLGLDKVFLYQFDAASGRLTPNEPAFASVAPGSGPRHLAFHPDGQFVYLINEMLCTITVFAFDAERGRLETLQTVSTLPAGQAVLPSDSTAEIEVHPTGKFLYGSNRGHDSIAAYRIDPKTGRLTLVQHVPTQGRIPRSFGIDPTGAYLLAANQESNSVVPFRIDPSSGRLSPVGEPIEVGAPVCVRFLAPSN